MYGADSNPIGGIRILDLGVARRPLSCVLLVEHKSLPATNCSLYVASPQYQSVPLAFSEVI